MRAKSIKGISPVEIKNELAQSMADGFKPTLAIVFLSILHNREELSEIFSEKEIAIFGATSNGEFTSAGITEGGISVLLLDVNPDYFSILFSEFPEKNYRETTQAIAIKALEKFERPCFLIAGSNLETDAEALLNGFEDVIGKHVNVYGGMAGDDKQLKEQFVFTTGKCSNRGIVTLVLDEDKLTIKGIATCGWKPMGTVKTVTKSNGNIVYSIENVSPLELTKKYSGLDNLTPENAMAGIEIATSFPFQLQRKKGDPVMRPGLVVNWEDGSFICSRSVPQGSQIKFSLPPDFDVIEKVIDGCKKLKDEEIPEADAVVVFSCAGRLISLGPLMSEEIEGVRKVWDVPMAGMFSTAELARATDGNLEMHNLTNCCVVLKEK